VRRLAAAVAAAALIAGCGTDHHTDPTVVRVELEGATKAAETATGFVAAPGRIVTVAHVLDPDRRLVIRSGGKQQRGRVLRVDRRNDLALIAVPGGGSAPKLRPGIGAGATVRIIAIRDGKPTVLQARVRRPIRATVRGPGTGPYRRRALELSARVHPGDSGAPVVDRDGRVTGVLFARLSNGAPTAYAVDASALQAFTNR
jgi:S1-C subfamily serine protease